MKVRFPMYAEFVGYQEVDLPEEIYRREMDNPGAIWDYLESKWDHISLPKRMDMEYVQDSCLPDREAALRVYKNGCQIYEYPGA